MKINSAIEIENALFNRKEVEAKVEANITPKNEEALKLVSDKYSVPQDNVKIKGIYGSFGSQEFRVLAHVYKTKEDLEKTEVKTKQEKEAEKKALEDAEKAKAAEVEAKKKAEEEAKAAKEAAEAEKPKEEPKVEEPAKEEAPKEEVKVEDKKE
jgi:ribosomal protein S24E